MTVTAEDDWTPKLNAWESNSPPSYWIKTLVCCLQILDMGCELHPLCCEASASRILYYVGWDGIMFVALYKESNMAKAGDLFKAIKLIANRTRITVCSPSQCTMLEKLFGGFESSWVSWRLFPLLTQIQKLGPKCVTDELYAPQTLGGTEGKSDIDTTCRKLDATILFYRQFALWPQLVLGGALTPVGN